MKHPALFQLLVKLFGAAIISMCAGCVVPYCTGILRNTSALPVTVLIEHDAEYTTEHGTKFWRDGVEVKNSKLPYSPRLLPINARQYDKMTDSLPVISTANTLEFKLPAYAAVQLGHFHGFGGLHRVILKRDDASVDVLDSTAISKRAYAKAYTIGLDIQ